MLDIPRGLLIRCIAFVVGAVPLTLALNMIDPPPNLGGVAVIVYAAIAGFSIPEYYAKHPDESPRRSPRR